MAAITSSDVTVTVANKDRDIGGGGVFQNLTIASVAFGDGSLTYPTGGVPLPAIGQFGFKRGINFAAVQPPYDDGFVYKYDATNHKILMYTQGVLTGATAAAVNENGALVKNSAGAEAAAPRLPKTAASSTYDLGPMIELPNTVAPAAKTLKLLMIGE